MAGDRRTTPRISISGVRITYESASGERIEADALDLSTGGAFVRTASPLAVGKRVALEIQVIGQPGPWAALGRVVWARERGEGALAPPGMGIKLIDADDAVLAGIERLVETRESTEPGVGNPSSPPPRVSSVPPKAARPIVPVIPVAPAAPAITPVVALPPERERTLLGVGVSDDEVATAPPREESVAIDLVPKRPGAASVRPVAPAPRPEEVGNSPNGADANTDVVEKRGAGRWIAILLLLVVAGVAAYVLITGIVKYPLR
jgi:uncharacterized protein (TIGR02266 family)